MTIKHFIVIIIILLFVVGCGEKAEEVSESKEEITEEQTEEPILPEVIEESIPVEPEVIEEEPQEVIIDETIPEDTESKVEETESTSQTHIIEITADGFSPDTLTINAGDIVEWKNVRSGKLKQAMVIGNSPCSNIRSNMLMPGESFSWTFNDPVKCKFVEAITIVYIGEITVK